ncbi:MAG: 4-phosphoerythronate dehydrogenase [Lentisphaeria bacterium]|nr:4-phosphoerythronate dehydrogenase [Lentisphaeria bacterium]MBR3688002.1 4-phosphoerythronate dehydrogenase [Lentisphaeria bacterium]
MLIVADSKIPFLEGVFEPYADVRYLDPGEITPETVRDADALIVRTRTKCNAALLEHSRVGIVATATIGTDHIDINWCITHGIVCASAAGCNAASVAQYMNSALLRVSLRHNVDLRGKTLGVIGCGNVGTKVAAAAAALGMNVLLNDPPRVCKEKLSGFVDLETIQREADFITLHVPLWDAEYGPWRTEHMADEAFFRGLKRKPFFFNASRGDVVDESALKDAIKSGLISGAVLDVWHNEPEIDRELLSLVDFATPHIAGYSADGKVNGTAMSVEAVAKHFGIEPLLNFFPAKVPAPANPVITLDPASPHPLADAVFVSYDIEVDDAALRAAPEQFEVLRGSYRVRREFPAYTVRSDKPLPSELRDKLLKLGFRLD